MMQNRLNSLLIVIFLLILFTPAQANTYLSKETKDNIVSNRNEASSPTYRISLLTCSAGEEIYAYFGHTAIRVENLKTKEDYVYNYGQFNMDQPHFVWHFILGQTDYQMGKEPFNHFARIYTYINRNVSEQILNLKEQEAEKLVKNLQDNYKPQNRNYRYNYFYDNCSTRPYLVIRNSLEGTFIFGKKYIPRSWRDEVNKYTHHASWSNFGMNLLLGAPTDEDMTKTEQLFLPFNLETTFQSAQIKDQDGNIRPLVIQQCQVIQRDETRAIADRKNSTPSINATTAAILFFILTLLITFIDFKRKRITLWFDILLYIVFGLLGLVLIFMSVFSKHPCLTPNYELLLFNPLLLIVIGSIIRLSKSNNGRRYISKCLSKEQSSKRSATDKVVYALILCCIFFLIISCIIQFAFNHVIIQYYPPVSLILALCLLTRLLSAKKCLRSKTRR